MLVLSRKRGEKIIIGGNIEVVALGTHNGSIRIGVVAPDGVVVDREEVHEAKKQDIRRMID